MKFIGIVINCLCAGILLGKRYGKSNHLLLAEAGSCGWLLRIHQAAEGQCVEAWTKLRVLSYSIQLHCNFKDRKNNDDSSQHKTSTSIHSDYYCHFLDCQLASAFAVKCRFLYLQAPLPRDLGRSLLITISRPLNVLDEVGSYVCLAFLYIRLPELSHLDHCVRRVTTFFTEFKLSFISQNINHGKVTLFQLRFVFITVYKSKYWYLGGILSLM